MQTTNTSSGLSLKKVSKSFGQNAVLRDINLEIERGKLISLLGPSGCGKSTTLNVISGFEEPDEGEVILDGKTITHLPPYKRDTAVVFQDYSLFPHMRVEENISYGLRVRRLDKSAIAARVAEVMELLDLSKLGRRFPSELSGGQQQRVSLARALAVRPSLLLLDEPLSNLDAKLRKDIRVEIRTLQQELEQTAVFVTHDQEEALAISDFIAVFNSGKIEQFGSPADLWERPETAYVADFMGVENILPLNGATQKGGDVAWTAGAIVPDWVTDFDLIGFRPSGARIYTTASESRSAELSIRAKVVSSSYLGTHVRFACDIGMGEGYLAYVEHPTNEPLPPLGDGTAFIGIDRESVLPLKSSSYVPA